MNAYAIWCKSFVNRLNGYLTNDIITHYKWLPRIFPFTKTNQIINYLCL